MLTSKLEAAEARIRERWYPGFRWLLNDSAPWSPLEKPLSEATVALLSTCGLYRLDAHAAFDAWNDLGDPSFREIHIDTPPDRLRIAHSHYDHRHVVQDPGVALPISHFRQLAEEGVIGRLYPWAYSFMGYLPEPRQLIAETAPQVARRLRADGVDVAFLTPC
jgi:D-proline reductase (dithiol) PrdB